MNRARFLDLNGNEILLTTPGEVKNEATNIFSNQFRKQKHKFNEPLPSHWEQEYLPKDDIDSTIYNSLDNPLTLQEWMDVVKNSSNKFTAGISGVEYQMIKHASKKVHELLTQLANLCFSAQLVPTQWKMTSLFPIPKPKDWDYNIANTRLILLIECV